MVNPVVNKAPVVTSGAFKVTISDFKSFEKNTLRGFFTATLADGLIIHNLSLHERDGARWLAMPSEKFTDREGKVVYKKLIEFTDRAALDVFRDACLDAIDVMKASSSQSSPAPRTEDVPSPWNAQPTTQQLRATSEPQQSRSSRPAGTPQKQNRDSPEWLR